MNYLVIVLVAILIVAIAFKMNNFRTKLAFLFIYLGIAFLLITGFIAFSGNDFNLSSVDGLSSTIHTYAVWIGNAGSNIVKISTYAFKQEWKNDEGNSTEK